ncbi:noroxomaritidine/norcraugsodine reductase isoform X2 [Aegilops tauschii subsp. strangulata]|uniref:noroxomaritidine/norcraugsodine reductase isoform X2 n=1 Tax=Aegilops tauschii subsp. strangulata TaxID=200361 RepID=UPI00098A1ED6|nr:noroxomaritidine/norcraugsodine reductase isoform X3 [Aegilops tauschii subsp. strangulata]
MAAGGMSREARWSLAGATALVTGGSKGIGHAIVEELAGHGARVHTCARSAAELEECRRRWESRGLPVTVSVCDVSLRASREQLVETAKQVFDGKLDMLIIKQPHQQHPTTTTISKFKSKERQSKTKLKRSNRISWGHSKTNP